MLTVLHGAFHPDLEEALVARLHAVKKRDPLAPVLVVAPSRRLARYLSELCAKAFPKGLAAVRFHNLYSFARAIDEESPPPGTRVVDDDALLERLVVELVRREFGERPYLRRALGVPGTARAILGALKELRDGGVVAEHALEAMREHELTGGEESVKLAEILSLHWHYVKELRDRGWRDRADVVTRAAERAPRSKLLAGQKAILSYGFYELVQTQIDLLKAVAGAFDTAVFYPYRDRPEYAFCRDFFAGVLGGGEKHAIEPSLFAGTARRRIASASGPRDEVWAAAKEVLRLRDRGFAFDEIAVIARSLEPYAELAESVFREHRIPFTSSARLPEPPARSIALLSLADDGFPRDSVLGLLDGDDVPLWDVVTRVLGIGRGREEWERRLFPWDGREYVHGEGGRHEPKLRVPAEKMTALVAAVRDLMRRATGPDRGTWAEHAAWARGLVGRRDEIDSLEAFDAVAPPPSGAEFRELLRERLRRASRPAGAENVRGVQVLDAMAARGMGFRAVILLGLNERVWPRFILEDPFLPDGVRQQFRFRLGNQLSLKLAGYEEERLLFTLACDAAREELLVLWQRADEKGRVQVRSPFIDEGAPPVPRRPGARLADVPLELLTPKEAAVRALLTAPRAAGQAEAVARAFGWDAETFAESVHFLHALEDDRVAGPRDGIVGRLDGYWTALTARGLSPTSLETYAQCPWSYFAHKVLDLDPPDAPEEAQAFTPMETGSLYHRVLERFYRSFDGHPLPVTLDGARAGFERSFDETVREFEASRTMPYPLLWEAERARMRRVLEAFLTHDLANRGGFVPAFFEERVGGTLDLPLGPHRAVPFMGYIDRLDVAPDGAFRVIDYKSTRSQRYRHTMQRGVLGLGRYLQPPIYFLLAERLLRERGRVPLRDASSSGYAFLEEFAKGEPDRELWLRGDFWENRDAFARILERYLTSIADGIFHIREGLQCQYCDFALACRRRHQPTRWRAIRAAREADGAAAESSFAVTSDTASFGKASEGEAPVPPGGASEGKP